MAAIEMPLKSFSVVAIAHRCESHTRTHIPHHALHIPLIEDSRWAYTHTDIYARTHWNRKYVLTCIYLVSAFVHTRPLQSHFISVQTNPPLCFRKLTRIIHKFPIFYLFSSKCKERAHLTPHTPLKSEFSSNFAQMPWLALPFEERRVVGKLRQRSVRWPLLTPWVFCVTFQDLFVILSTSPLL